MAFETNLRAASRSEHPFGIKAFKNCILRTHGNKDQKNTLMPLQAVEQGRKTENETKSTGELMPHRLCSVQPASSLTHTKKDSYTKRQQNVKNIKHISSTANSELEHSSFFHS